MDTIPEELIHQICSYLVPLPPLLDRTPTQELHSLCLVSRKIYRVARSLLYTSVTTNSVDTVRQLLRTFEETPALVDNVKYFASQHDMICCSESIQNNPRKEGSCKCPILTLRTLALLPNLTTLNLMQVPHMGTDFIWLRMFHGEESERNRLRHLRKLSLDLGHVQAHEISQFLTLPALKTLELNMRRKPGDSDRPLDVLNITSNVESLSIIRCAPSRKEDLRWLCTVLNRLRELLISVPQFTDLDMVVTPFSLEQQNMLQRVHIYDEYEMYYGIEVDTLYEDELVATMIRNEALEEFLNHADPDQELEEKGYIDINYQAKGVKSVLMRPITEKEQMIYYSVSDKIV